MVSNDVLHTSFLLLRRHLMRERESLSFREVEVLQNSDHTANGTNPSNNHQQSLP
jgi:hypothetical protein